MKSLIKMLKIASAMFFIVLLFSGFTPAPLEIEIDVAPSVLNLANQGEVVTVHTDIVYSNVDVSTVFLNGVEIDHWKADSRGNFVAKFLIEEIKKLDGLVIGDYNTLTFVGATIEGMNIEGSQEIKVIKVVPAGKK